MGTLTITPVILAGGKGTRLWPLSRSATPKQFCKINDELSLFQQTVKRLCDAPVFSDPIVLTNASYLTQVKMQMEEIQFSAQRIICEPCGRDTAPAVALAAVAGKQEKSEILLVLPSDHKVLDSGKFLEAANKAASIVKEFGKIVTFGITPTEPATGYGYLEAGPEIADGLGHNLLSFIEKPNLEKAQELIAIDTIFWNAGIFMFTPHLMCQELQTHAPDLYAKASASFNKSEADGIIIYPEEVAFSAIDPISIDYAVMEKTAHAALVPVDPQWTDVGSWGAVWDASKHDENGNVVIGDALGVDVRDSLISTDGPFVGVAGISDVVVVANKDAVLITSRKNSQSVKLLIDELKHNHEEMTLNHVSETRPWGSFTSLNKGENYQVKTITVEPGGQLSLQYHFHRAEHWIVVRGTATVTVNDDVTQLIPCQQVFIPQGAVHRLENMTDEPVQIIEVQYGSYLGEDDIVRVEDVYGRPDVENPTIGDKVA